MTQTKAKQIVNDYFVSTVMPSHVLNKNISKYCVKLYLV